MEQRMSSCCLLLSPLTSGLRILLLDRAEPALLDRILLQVSAGEDSNAAN